jgi:hypothetical protein
MGLGHGAAATGRPLVSQSVPVMRNYLPIWSRSSRIAMALMHMQRTSQFLKVRSHHEAKHNSTELTNQPESPIK